MVRESADGVFVVRANRRYRILQTEPSRAGITQSGPETLALTNSRAR
jgi:hypothetical protein